MIQMLVVGIAGVARPPQARRREDNAEAMDIPIAATSRIDLILLSRPGCPGCAAWRAEQVHGQRRLADSAAFAHIRYAEVSRPWTDSGASGQPRFMLMVDGRSVLPGHTATDDWGLVETTLRRAVALKTRLAA